MLAPSLHMHGYVFECETTGRAAAVAEPPGHEGTCPVCGGRVWAVGDDLHCMGNRHARRAAVAELPREARLEEAATKRRYLPKVWDAGIVATPRERNAAKRRRKKARNR